MRIAIIGIMFAVVANPASACFRPGYDLNSTVEYLECKDDENEQIIRGMQAQIDDQQARLDDQDEAIRGLLDAMLETSERLSQQISDLKQAVE